MDTGRPKVSQQSRSSSCLLYTSPAKHAIVPFLDFLQTAVLFLFAVFLSPINADCSGDVFQYAKQQSGFQVVVYCSDALPEVFDRFLKEPLSVLKWDVYKRQEQEILLER